MAEPLLNFEQAREKLKNDLHCEDKVLMDPKNEAQCVDLLKPHDTNPLISRRKVPPPRSVAANTTPAAPSSPAPTSSEYLRCLATHMQGRTAKQKLELTPERERQCKELYSSGGKRKSRRSKKRGGKSKSAKKRGGKSKKNRRRSNRRR